MKGAIQRCMRAYCSSDDKEKAICNQAEDFASWCYGLTGKIPQFREKDFCRKFTLTQNEITLMMNGTLERLMGQATTFETYQFVI